MYDYNGNPIEPKGGLGKLPIDFREEKIVPDEITFSSDDGQDVYLRINRNGLYAKGVYDMEGNKIGKNVDNQPANPNSGNISSSEMYNLNMAEGLLRLEAKNPFELSPLDDGYISFVWDDLRVDLDLVASIFAEFNFPMGVAAIPGNLGRKMTGLQSPSHGYDTNMSALEVCQRIVELGGEIMAHNGPYITSTNQYDYDFMYNHFVTTRKKLEEAGFIVRGLIRAGGVPSDISPDKKILDKWLIGNYEYSNLGTLPQFRQDRFTIEQTISALKTKCDWLKNNHKWQGVMCHTLYEEGDSEHITASKLRELLQYITDINLNVVTYAYINDHFGSSKFLNFINS